MAEETRPDQQTQTQGGIPPLGGIAPEGAMVAAGGGGIVLPAGGITLDDPGKKTTDQLGAGAPAFGNLLKTVGDAVVTSQKLLDQSVIDTVNALNDTNIDVVTTMVVELKENGQPDATLSKPIINNLSVLNFFTPTFHEWKSVGISMDLEVTNFHAEQALQFNQHQASQSYGGSYAWGFGGWFSYQQQSSDVSLNRNSQVDTSWSSGSCRIDAELGPRRTGKFPVPASFTIGPRIYIAQGKVNETKNGTVVSSRDIDLIVQVRKADGSPNPGKTLDVDGGTLLVSFLDPAGTTAAGTSTTDPQGRIKINVKRNLGSNTGYQKLPVTVSLQAVSKTFNVTL